MTVPKANYIAVRGKGDPDEEDGAYQEVVGALYAVAYTLKMSYKTDYKREYFYSELDKKFSKLKELYMWEYGNSYIVNSRNNKKLMTLFHEFCEANKIVHDNDSVFNYLNLFEEKKTSKQISFFDEI